jgi:HD domain
VSKRTYAGALEELTGRTSVGRVVTEGRTDAAIMADPLAANGVHVRTSALEAGASAVGIATGVHGIEELTKEGAHVALTDLSDTECVVSALRRAANFGRTGESVAGSNETESVDWAWNTSRDLLAPVDTRWPHVQGVRRRAEVLAKGFTWGDRDLLVRATLLHDIGYAPDVRDTGLHALDGARWLRAHGASERLCSLVAFHSCAEIEADERGLRSTLDEDFIAEESRVADALTAADMMTGPAGDEMDVHARLAEVLVRYPENHEVHKAILRAGPRLVGSVRRDCARVVFDASR